MAELVTHTNTVTEKKRKGGTLGGGRGLALGEGVDEFLFLGTIPRELHAEMFTSSQARDAA